MRPMFTRLALAALCCALHTPSALAAPITASNTVSAAAVTGGGDFSGTDTGHTGIAGLYTGTGFSAGEAFAGQAVAFSPTGFETVSGAPTSPLALQSPASTDGVTRWGGAELQGLTGGACGDPCTGEGAVSFLFAAPQSQIGLDIIKFEAGAVVLRFFTPDGAAFDSLSLAPGAASWTFTAPTGSTIGGVTITNDDRYGIALDNLRLSPAPTAVPAPGTTAAAMLLLAGLAAGRAPRRAR